jgi:hypothetical protein
VDGIGIFEELLDPLVAEHRSRGRDTAREARRLQRHALDRSGKLRRRRQSELGHLPRLRAEPRVGHQIAAADEEVPDVRLLDARLEQAPRRRQPRGPGNPQIAGDLQQDEPRVRRFGQLLLLGGGSAQRVSESGDGLRLPVAHLLEELAQVRPVAGLVLAQCREDGH